MNSTNNKVPFSFDSIAYYIIIIVTFLVPLAFVPGGYLSLPFTKSAIFSIGIIAAFIFFIIERIRQGSITFPFALVSIPLISLPIIYLASSFMSVERSLSLMGYGFETETLLIVSLLCLYSYLIFALFRQKKSLFLLFSALFGSIVIALLFQIARLIGGPAFLSFGVFGIPAASIIGRWNELGIISGLLVILSFIALETLALPKWSKILLYILVTVSFGFISLSNFAFNFHYFSVPLSLLIGLGSLIFFSYIYAFGNLKNRSLPTKNIDDIKASEQNKPQSRIISYPALFVLLFSIVLVFFGGRINTSMTNYFGISYTEGRPSWVATGDLIGKVVQARPFLGSGPQTFNYEWNLHKSPLFNNDALFWDADFGMGIGYIPSTLITVGPIGFLAWMLLVISSTILSYKLLKASSKDRMTNFLKLALVCGTLYFTLVSLIYIPSIVSLMIWFLFLGGLFAFSQSEGKIREKSIMFFAKRELSFYITLLLTIGAIGASILLIEFSKKVSASVNASRAIIASSGGDTKAGQRFLARAIYLDEKSGYLKLLAQNSLVRLNQISSEANEGNIEQYKPEIQQMVDIAVQASLRAEFIEKTNFRNYLSTGTVFEALGTYYGVPNSIVAAKEKYNQALTLVPTSPIPYLLIARAEATEGNTEIAKENLAKAIQLKNNYVDAYVLLSQIAATEGNRQAAESILENVILIDPSNVAVSYQVGLMKYEAKKYEAAINDFARALLVNPLFANARYFLSLSLYQTDKDADAIREMQQVLVTNPDNAEVKELIRKMENNEALFTTSAPVVEEEEEALEE